MAIQGKKSKTGRKKVAKKRSKIAKSVTKIEKNDQKLNENEQNLNDESKPKRRGAPKGNQYWRLAHNWKKPVKLKPREILPKAIEYIRWCDENPLKEEKAFGTGFIATMNKLRAPTIQGFCFYCNMSIQTWYEYEGQKAYSEFIARAKAMFFSIKFEGAAAGLLDSNIIARETGLTEKHEHSGRDGGPIETKTEIDYSKLSDAALREISKATRPKKSTD